MIKHVDWREAERHVPHIILAILPCSHVRYNLVPDWWERFSMRPLSFVALSRASDLQSGVQLPASLYESPKVRPGETYTEGTRASNVSTVYRRLCTVDGCGKDKGSIGTVDAVLDRDDDKTPVRLATWLTEPVALLLAARMAGPVIRAASCFDVCSSCTGEAPGPVARASSSRRADWFLLGRP